MREEMLPLFPLPLVLLPRTPLPLHIFEDRYKELIGEAIAADTEFGIVLARAEGVVNTGCTATVSKVVERYDDGRLDIITTGRRRFELIELVEGRSFLQGKVRFFDDVEIQAPGMDVKQRAVEAYTQARQATGQEPSQEPEWTDPQLSFQLAQIVSDADFRQNLLNTRSESERLKRLADYFPVHVVRFRHSEQLKVAAPRNGHSKHIPIRD
jgi:Lon protease-like protein